VAAENSAVTAHANPLLEPWTAAFGMPPFARLRAEHFAPALHAAMAQHRQELATIGAQAEPPSFANTVAAYDRSGRLLGRVASVFYNLNNSATSDALQAVQREMAAPLAAHHSAVVMDAALFARIDALHKQRHSLGLDAESLRLLERVHLDFVRAGAKLDAASQQRYAAVMQELAKLTTQFAQNVLHDETEFVLELHGEGDLAGLPDSTREATRQAALDRGRQGHVVTLSRSLVVPFLTFSERRDLREKAWRAWTSRGEHAGAHDNREVARRILALRNEQARLHGHSCFADYALADTMAGKQSAVQALLDEVWPRALEAVLQEREALQGAMLAAGSRDGSIEAWDWRFWAERVRVARYAVDDAEVKSYFKLEHVVAAAFDCAERLFGLRFKARPDVPVYHDDVKAYEVSDAQGRLVGLFLQDNFARTTKRSGAWMSALRWQRRNGGDDVPVILNNNNFAKGSAGAPTLLSMDDARTLFHEFGHGLHGLLSSVTYERLSGTQVLRDFVELPSQIFEHWITEPEVLERHARHYKTGMPIPRELITRMQRARRFNQGYETVRYTASAMVDMAAHALTDAEAPADLCAFEREVLARIGLPDGVGLNHRLVHFQHLFASSAYAAGYYVYIWAEVLDADGYDAFAEAGSPFDADVAARLKRFIYASGNSLEPGAAFASFRGRAPTVQPLLRKRGLLADATAD
jgi:peptidyl-dipeptidase Dcp